MDSYQYNAGGGIKHVGVEDEFTETMFAEPYLVTLWPDDPFFEPTPGTALGIETGNLYGTERLIVRYDAQPKRKVSGTVATWPGGIVYVWERQVSGWKRSLPSNLLIPNP